MKLFVKLQEVASLFSFFIIIIIIIIIYKAGSADNIKSGRTGIMEVISYASYIENIGIKRDKRSR